MIFHGLSLILIGIFPTVISHVRLVYPPARYPSLDFLDNSRTSGPCGVSKQRPGPGTHTRLLTGSLLNVSWFMAYPHQGGYRIELLDSNERLKTVLTPSGADRFVGTFDQTKESDIIRLPPETCTHCVIRLIRQASEWGGNYQFWSCSDVNLVNDQAREEKCSGHGKFSRGKCFCEPLSSGDYCQFKDECHADAHCGFGKLCKWMSHRADPKWGCFQSKRVIRSPNSPIPSYLFNPAEFKVRTVGNGHKIYWKIYPNKRQIKFVLQFKTTAWIAIGWKPKNINPSQCVNLVRGIKWLKKYDHIARSLPEPEPHPEGEKSVAEPEPEPESESIRPKQGIPLNECEGVWKYPASCNGNSCQYKVHWAFGGVQEEIAFFLEARTPGDNWWTGIGFSPTGRMSDADMVIVKIQGGILSLYDMHSTGYSAPIIDTQQDVFTRITPLIAHENGRLRVMFGRKLNTNDPKFDSIFRKENCLHFLFPVSGGPLDSSGNMLKHRRTPVVSPGRICIGECRTKTGGNGRWKRDTDWRSHFPNPARLQRFREPFRNLGNSEEQRFREPNPEHEPAAEDEPEPHPEGEKPSSAEPEPEPSGEGGRGEDDLHPMDCADIVLGSTDGNSWRINDYYTVSRATPRLDEFYNGEQSIIESLGFEQNGITTLMFRKKLDANDRADHSIIPGPMTLIWATGQEFGKYKHYPDSALERNNYSQGDFYEPHVPRYHGHGQEQRGVLSVDFYN